MFQRVPFASRTLIFGFVPVTSSLTNLNGGFGALFSPPIPQKRSSLATSPGSRHSVGVPLAASGFSLPLPFFCFAKASDVGVSPEVPRAQTRAMANAAIHRLGRAVRANIPGVLLTLKAAVGSCVVAHCQSRPIGLTASGTDFRNHAACGA